MARRYFQALGTLDNIGVFVFTGADKWQEPDGENQ